MLNVHDLRIITAIGDTSCFIYHVQLVFIQNVQPESFDRYHSFIFIFNVIKADSIDSVCDNVDIAKITTKRFRRKKIQ